MRAKTSAGAALAALALLATTEQPSDNVRALQLVKLLAFTCQAYKEDHPTYPVSEGLVSAEFLAPHLTPVYVGRLMDRDAWGRPLMYASDGIRIAIVSFGADGKPDREYVSWDPPQGKWEGDDIVWSGGHLVACPPELCALEENAREETAAILKTIGIAVEAYRVDHGTFPKMHGFQPVAFLRRHVEPTYISRLPLMDGWGNTLHYWSDGEHYRVASPGADGTPDQPYDQVAPGSPTKGPESDLVLADGAFLKGPN